MSKDDEEWNAPRLDFLDTIPEDASVTAARAAALSTASAVASSDDGEGPIGDGQRRRGATPSEMGQSVVSETPGEVGGGDTLDQQPQQPQVRGGAAGASSALSKKCTLKTILFYVLLSLMLVAVAVGIYYIARTASDDEDDTSEIPSTSGMGNTAPSPSPSEEEPVLAPFDTTFLESEFPTPTPAYDGQDLVDLEQTLLTISRAQDLEDSDTPQGTCSHWLSQKDGQSLRVSKAGPERIVQRYVLCTLYYATNGDGWTMPFLDGTLHECDWTGVYCHQDGDIVHIVDLPAINLVGSLPEELIYLEHLEGLILSGNSLTGTLPSQLFELSSLLVFFDLSNNLLAGELPDVWDAPNLSSLDLHSNQFLRSFPAQLLELTSLVYLDLADNNLRGPIPTPLRDDSPLEVLRLYENQFSGTLPFFPQLQELDVYSNNIIQIDSRYATSETLKLLVAYDNLLVNKLPEKWDAPNLSYLDLHSNQLTGTIPLSIWSLTKLETLILHVNGLTGTLPAKTSSSFKHVWLHSNNFSGTLDEDFGAIWINLTTMLLYGNQLTGLVDGQCRGWSQLERLEVDCDLMCNCCTADCKQ